MQCRALELFTRKKTSSESSSRHKNGTRNRRFCRVWLRRPGRRLRMERLGGILQKTATACCWFRRRLSTGGARASSPERPRALLAIPEVANKSVLWSWVACACRSCGIRSPTTNVYDRDAVYHCLMECYVAIYSMLQLNRLLQLIRYAST